jgi:PIN domain nuclease of toxin-antitoxin system
VILLDTHAWLWWVSEPSRLSARAREAIEGDTRVGVSTVSVWEVATLHRRGRITLDRDVRDWVARSVSDGRIDSFWPPTVDVALVAAGLDGASFPGDPADRLIFATARVAGGRLVTRDERILSFSADDTIW